MNNLVPFRISICGLTELADHCATRVSHVLSILDPDWPVPEVFGTFGEHAKLELRFHDVTEAGEAEIIAPQPAHVTALLAFGRELQTEQPANAHLLVHCHAGVSRSTAAMALLLAQALPEVPEHWIFDEILSIRPQAWPNLRLLELGDPLLNRNGKLAAAAVGVYRRQLKSRPELAAQMRAGGRGREVSAALG